MERAKMRFIFLFCFLSLVCCSPELSPEKALEIVWPHRFINQNDSTAILDFRGVNLFYFSQGGRTSNGRLGAVGFYDFRGDTIIFYQMTTEQLYSHSKFDSSYLVQRILNYRWHEKDKPVTPHVWFEEISLNKYTWILKDINTIIFSNNRRIEIYKKETQERLR